MENLIYLDFKDYAAKLLSDDERKLLDGLDISLCIDPDQQNIYRSVCFCKEYPNEMMEEQDEVINKFMQKLHDDEEIRLLMAEAASEAGRVPAYM